MRETLDGGGARRERLEWGLQLNAEGRQGMSAWLKTSLIVVDWPTDSVLAMADIGRWLPDHCC